MLLRVPLVESLGVTPFLAVKTVESLSQRCRGCYYSVVKGIRCVFIDTDLFKDFAKQKRIYSLQCERLKFTLAPNTAGACATWIRRGGFRRQWTVCARYPTRPPQVQDTMVSLCQYAACQKDIQAAGMLLVERTGWIDGVGGVDGMVPPWITVV